MTKTITLKQFAVQNLKENDALYQKHKLFQTPLIPGLALADFFLGEGAKLPPRGVPISIASNLRMTQILDEADFALVPHEFSGVRQYPSYLEYLESLAKRLPLIVFNTGDESPKLNIENAIEIRTFFHPRESRARKILIPYPARAREFSLREWKPTPTISFMGYLPKLTPGSLFGQNGNFLHAPIQSSVYLNRRIALNKLGALTKKFDVKIVKRDKFTAFHKNPELTEHSKEYERSLANSDYVLCPRGFGNTSIRFFEALSAGRTPILVESGGGLPKIADQKDWKSHILRVGIFDDWFSAISADWLKLGRNNSYLERQFSNFELFNEDLNTKSQLQKIFQDYMLPIT